MRIAYVTTELRPGGAEKCLVRVARHFAGLGQQVRVISLRNRPADGDAELVEILAENGIETVFCGLTGWTSLPSTRSRLREQLREFRPDLIHSFLFHAHAAVLHCFPPNQPGWIVSERVADPRFFRRKFSQRFYQRADAICCVSQSVANALPQPSRWQEKTWVIGNGVDIAGPQPPAPLADFEIPESSRILLAAGRLHPQKGFDELIDHAAEFLASFDDTYLVIAGSGDQRADLENRIAKSSVGSRIKLIGHRTDLAAWQQRAEIFLLPSRWEGMPNVLLEAMSAGCAVVAFNVEGVSEIVPQDKDEIQSQVVANRDWSQFAEQVIRELANPGALGDQNRAAMLKQSWAAVLTSYESMYASLADP